MSGRDAGGGGAAPSGDQSPRIQRALAYIAANLDRPLTVAEVARAAFVSEFHFHRIFSAIMREPVGQFITRKRLETAALMLAYHRWRSVTEIASACGYSSTANFSKAFSAYFGCKPGDIRKPAASAQSTKISKVGKLTSKYGKDFAPADLYRLPTSFDTPPLTAADRERRLAEIEKEVRFETRLAMNVACLSSPHGYDVETVTKTWDELIARGRHLELCGENVDSYGIIHDTPTLTKPELCRYSACIPIPPEKASLDLPPPLFRDVLPAGRYAIFRHQGPVSELERTYSDVYAIWFPASSLAPDDFRPIEHYVNDAPQDGSVDMDILIKVRPNRGSL